MKHPTWGGESKLGEEISEKKMVLCASRNLKFAFQYADRPPPQRTTAQPMHPPLQPRLFAPLFVLGLLLNTSCESAPTPAPTLSELRLPESLKMGVSHHFGTLLAGARVQHADGDDNLDALPTHALELRLLSLERLPNAGLQLLAAHTRMVATPHGHQPIRGATRCAVGAGFVQGEAAREFWQALLSGSAGRSVLASEYSGVLPRGLSCTLSLEVTEHVEDSDNFLREWPDRAPVAKRLRVGVEWRLREGLGIGLGFSDLVPGSRSVELGPPPEGGRPDGDYLQHEWIVPDLAPSPTGGPLVFTVPSPFDTGEGAAYAIWVEVKAIDGTQDNSLDEVLADAQAAGALVDQAQRSATPEELQRRHTERAYAKLQTPVSADELRGILLHLVAAGEAPLGADLGLVADETVLRAWVAGLPELDPAQSNHATQVSWQLERAAWLHLVQLAMRDGLALWLESMLVRHAGEVGRYPSTLEELARRAPNGAAFHKRLIAENRIFLEDSNISARVRAFDWLQQQASAPAGFDPLASKQERRDALASATNDSGGSQ